MAHTSAPLTMLGRISVWKKMNRLWLGASLDKTRPKRQTMPRPMVKHLPFVKDGQRMSSTLIRA